MIMNSCEHRPEGVLALQQNITRILEIDPSRRSAAEHSLIIGLLKQRNSLRDRICRNWPSHQFQNLCKRLRISRVKAFRKICEVDTRGTTAFLVLRGGVRLLSKVNSLSDSKYMYSFFFFVKFFI